MKLPHEKKYPKEIHVNEETYQVKFVKRIRHGAGRTQGLCDSGSHTIYIQKGLTKSQTFRTFIHELLHAIEFEYCIKIRHKTVYQLEKAIGDLILVNW